MVSQAILDALYFSPKRDAKDFVKRYFNDVSESHFVKAKICVRVSFNGGNSFNELTRVTPASNTQEVLSEMLESFKPVADSDNIWIYLDLFLETLDSQYIWVCFDLKRSGCYVGSESSIKLSAQEMLKHYNEWQETFKRTKNIIFDNEFGTNNREETTTFSVYTYAKPVLIAVACIVVIYAGYNLLYFIT